MKKRNKVTLLLSSIMVLSLITGCSNSKPKETYQLDTNGTIEKIESDNNAEKADGDSTEKSNTAENGTEQKENQGDFSFADMTNKEFYFSSGAGGWCTVMYVKDDGSFSGQYHDSDMGDAGEGYPDGTFYYCEFTGQFTTPEKVDDYTYSVKIDHMDYQDEPEKEEIKDNMKYIYSEAYGLNQAEEILIYLPGKPLKDIPQEYKTWVGYYDESATTDTELPFYGIYNVTPQYGFSSYDMDDTSVSGDDNAASSNNNETPGSIDDELAAIEQQETALYDKLQKEDLTQSEMTQVACEVYQLWDNELNSIWNRLTEQLDQTTMDNLKAEEKQWIATKEEEIKKAGAECEGGTIQPMIEATEGGELTKQRVYELADYLK